MESVIAFYISELSVDKCELSADKCELFVAKCKLSVDIQSASYQFILYMRVATVNASYQASKSTLVHTTQLQVHKNHF